MSVCRVSLPDLQGLRNPRRYCERKYECTCAEGDYKAWKLCPRYSGDRSRPIALALLYRPRQRRQLCPLSYASIAWAAYGLLLDAKGTIVVYVRDDRQVQSCNPRHALRMLRLDRGVPFQCRFWELFLSDGSSIPSPDEMRRHNLAAGSMCVASWTPIYRLMTRLKQRWRLRRMILGRLVPHLGLPNEMTKSVIRYCGSFSIALRLTKLPPAHYESERLMTTCKCCLRRYEATELRLARADDVVLCRWCEEAYARSPGDLRQLGARLQEDIPEIDASYGRGTSSSFASASVDASSVMSLFLRQKGRSRNNK